MIGLLILVFLLSCIFMYFYKNAYKKPENFPPGPPNYPVYGGYAAIRATEWSNLAKACLDLGKKYKTKLLGVYLTTIPAVIVNDPELIKKMLLHEDFDGRMDIIVARLRSYWKKLGIFFTDGYFWHVQRRFSLRYMRDFGFGRRDEGLEEMVENEVKEMIGMVTGGQKYPSEQAVVRGNLVYLPYYFAAPFMNGMLHVIARMTLPRSEYGTLWDLTRKILIFQRSTDDFGGVLSLQPWLKSFAPKLSGYKGLREGNGALLAFIENLVNKVMEDHDESHNRHFMDVYIRQMKQDIKEKGRSTYSVDQLVLTCVDYMFPASSAVQSVLEMLVERMLLEPHIQDKIHEEIDRVVGRDRMPNLDDRRNMPYTEACIREMMRIETVVPLGVPHRAMTNTKFEGYDIPEGTMVSANYIGLHMDKEIWGDPHTFRPERFIVNGKLDVSLDKTLPFGAGRRLCAGETYARQSMFQVFAGFMQAFHVSTADGKPLTKLSERMQGLITTIPEFWVKVTPRK